MGNSRHLGLFLMAPAFLFIGLFFVAPVLLTAVFGFTNMSTATGIGGGSYMVSQSSMEQLKQNNALKDIAGKLAQVNYTIDEKGLKEAAGNEATPALLGALRNKFFGKSFASRRNIEQAIKGLDNRPSSFRKIKTLAAGFKHSILNARFDSKEKLFAAIKGLGISLNAAQKSAIAKATYTGWIFTAKNFQTMISLPDTKTALINTLIYVFTTLILFNTGFALVLAISTHYMDERPAGFFRSVWLLPRLTPPVLYVLMWKWLAWDTGFLSALLAPLGFQPRNWMLDTSTNAWTFIILINGMVGASLGMIIFASAIKAIPQSLFHASEVDGASRKQQIWYIILPQLRWPILFITSYQTLSLLTSFEYILLSTDGGPGSTTLVWALAAYKKALSNYAGSLEYGYGAAMALVLVVIGVVMSLFYLRLFDFKSLTAPPKID